MDKEKGLFARIPLQNIKFEDPYEQSKFEKIKSEDLNKAINCIETVLNNTVMEISFNQRT